jgi:flagellar export protein FliJ
MRDEPLRTLLRLRRLALDEARQTFAACLEVEATEAGRVRGIERSIQAETDRASSLDGNDMTVETFARWLRRVRAEQEAAERALHEAEARTAEARVVLGASRQAVEAVETEIERRDALERQEGTRREQRMLDEIGGRAGR